MMKKFILVLAATIAIFSLSACTSGSSSGEEEIVAEDGSSQEQGIVEEGGGEAALEESLDGVDANAQTSDTTGSADSTVAETTNEDQLTIDSFGEGADVAQEKAEPPPEIDTLQEPQTPNTSDVATNTGGEEIAPPTTMNDVTQQETPQATTDLDQPKPAGKSLQKVAATPWKAGKSWVNGIYFARPGDSLSSISQTIYGDDRTSQLKKINPTYNNRDVKPGDKVYYASVVRPDDSEKVLTFFEEKNIPPKIYTAKAGDNIRKVSKELLGYPEAWKEVWASNTIESKQDMDEGAELRYWDTNMASTMPVSDQAPQPLADNGNTPPPQQMPDPSVPPQDPGAPPAANDFPPPPDFPPADNGGGMNTAELPPPPPPPDIPPPPPPPMDIPAPPAVAQTDDGATGAAGDDQMLMMGAGGVAVVALLLILVRRKRKQKELEQALGETHVG